MYNLIATDLLDREPNQVGSTEWWQWFREACAKRNPYAVGTPQHKLWKQRVQTNPFKQGTTEYARWRRGCCPYDNQPPPPVSERLRSFPRSVGSKLRPVASSTG